MKRSTVYDRKKIAEAREILMHVYGGPLTANEFKRLDTIISKLDQLSESLQKDQ